MKNYKIKPKDIELISAFFKGLSSDKRQDIIFKIFTDKKEHNVSEVAEKANIAVSTASEHLAILKRSGILKSNKIDKDVYYSINKDQIKYIIGNINTWLNCC